MAAPLRIGLYLDPWHTYVRDVLSGVRTAAAGRGWELYSPWPGHSAWPDPCRLGLAGVIAGIDLRGVPQPASAGLPLARVGTVAREDLPADVTWDDAQIGRIAAEHLLEQGHRALCVWRENNFLYQHERERGFCEAVGAAGLAPISVYVPDEDTATREARLRALPEPCGVFCVSDRIGHELLRLAERIGRRVPESLAVVSAGNDEDYCELTAPPMSSVALPGRQAGHAAVDVLAAKLDGGAPSTALPLKIALAHVAVRRSSDLLAIDDLEVLRALRAIRDEAVRGLTVARVHERSGVSRRNLEQRFKRIVGRSLGDEIARVRHREAQRLLSVTRAPVADIAERCGFHTPQRFAAAFAQLEGCSPSAYRARSRKSATASGESA